MVALGPHASALPVLFELSLDRREEILAHQGGNLDEDLILRRCIDPRDGSTGMLGAAALRAEPLRLVWPRRVSCRKPPSPCTRGS